MDLELAAIRAITTRLPPAPGAGRIAHQLLRPLYLRRPRSPVEMEVLGLALRLDPGQAVDAGLIFYPQLYNRAEFRWLRQRLKPGQLFADVGAYLGVYALLAARLTERVVAIEANPATYARLADSIRRNKARVTTFNVGVSDRRGRLPFYVQDTGNLGGSSFVFRSGAEPIMVECRPLVELAPKADFLKLDVEGMEARVLAPYLADHRPHTIILEVLHDKTALELCVARGYQVRARSRENVLLTI